MYYLRIDSKKQMFVIEDRQGNTIAYRDMPSQSYPNPGTDRLMKLDGNTEAYNLIEAMIGSANTNNRRG